jgi:hypothetical protein
MRVPGPEFFASLGTACGYFTAWLCRYLEARPIAVGRAAFALVAPRGALSAAAV